MGVVHPDQDPPHLRLGREHEISRGQILHQDALGDAVLRLVEAVGKGGGRGAGLVDQAARGGDLRVRVGRGGTSPGSQHGVAG